MSELLRFPWYYLRIWFQVNLDYQDFFNITQTGCLSGHIFMNVHKNLRSQKLKAMQKFIINP